GGDGSNYGGGPAVFKLRGMDGHETWRYWPRWNSFDSWGYSQVSLDFNADVIVSAAYNPEYIEKRSGSDGTRVWGSALGVGCVGANYRYDNLHETAVLPGGDVIAAGHSLDCDAPLSWPYVFTVERLDGTTGDMVWIRFLP